MGQKKFKVKGIGEPCPKCIPTINMQRRDRGTTEPPKQRRKAKFYFTEWDVCTECGFIKHYEKFKRFYKKQNAT